jgi:transglutaminase-like putative cysteine protease
LGSFKGAAMAILNIRHVTTYHYKEAVGFGEHRMMLRPRDDDDQMILESELTIMPTPSRLAWMRDRFGNHVAVAHFTVRASELRFESAARIQHVPSDFRAANIAEFARTCPFAYAVEDRERLAPFLVTLSRHPRFLRWVAGFLSDEGMAETYVLLVDLTRIIRRNFRHRARHEKAIQTPVQTLSLGSGCCRDFAVLMIAVLRSLGIAARFVSGYLNVADDEDWINGGNTHAWIQAYIPGLGWIDFDPSSGVAGNHDLIRVAVVGEPRQAIPLRGTWIGPASNFVAMKVVVRVNADAGVARDASIGDSRW